MGAEADGAEADGSEGVGLVGAVAVELVGDVVSEGAFVGAGVDVLIRVGAGAAEDVGEVAGEEDVGVEDVGPAVEDAGDVGAGEAAEVSAGAVEGVGEVAEEDEVVVEAGADVPVEDEAEVAGA